MLLSTSIANSVLLLSQLDQATFPVDIDRTTLLPTSTSDWKNTRIAWLASLPFPEKWYLSCGTSLVYFFTQYDCFEWNITKSALTILDNCQHFDWIFSVRIPHEIEKLTIEWLNLHWCPKNLVGASVY